MPRVLATLFFAAFGASAHAEDAAATFARYAGTYSTDCARPQAARAIVEADHLRVAGVKRPLKAARSEANSNFLGDHTPSEFEAALIGKLKDGRELVFLVYRDARGRHVRLAADVSIERGLGKAVGGTYRLCDAP